VVVDCFNDFLLLHADGKLFPELLDLLGSCDCVIACRNGYIGMSDVLQTVWLVFIVRQLHLLFILDYLQGFLAKGLKADLSSHQSVSLVG
jgi:hypothetical protein